MMRRAMLTALLATPAVVASALLPVAPTTKRGARVSADEKDPGYDPFAVQGWVMVFFNGAELKGCITADEQLGWALVWGPSFDRTREPGYVEMWGDVRIAYQPGHPKNPFRR